MSPFCDFLYTGILSAYILNRRMTNVRFAVSALCFLAYFLYDFIDYDGSSVFNFNFKTKPGMSGPILCFISRFFFCLQGVYSSRVLLLIGYENKQKHFAKLEKMKNDLKEAEKEDSKDVWISKDSVPYLKAEYLIHNRMKKQLKISQIKTNEYQKKWKKKEKELRIKLREKR